MLSVKTDRVINAECIRNLFTKEGEYRKIPNHKPKCKYSLEYHLAKTKSKKIEDKIKEIINSAKKLKDTKVVYSKKRICFKTNFKYMTIEIAQKNLWVCVKNINGWKCFRLNSNDHTGRIKKALNRIHGLSNKPIFKK